MLFLLLTAFRHWGASVSGPPGGYSCCGELCWAGGFAVPLLILLITNRWLYGSPFVTGYGDSENNAFFTPLATGLHGLLYSSGKGIIWYAPPLLFAIIGMPFFLRRFPREGIAIISAAAINLVFYARFRFWHGDGSWGPRYLVIVLPWLLLPALPVLDFVLVPGWSAVRTAARAGAITVLLAGIFVQSLAIAVSFDIPILTSTSDTARYFTPAQSPLVLSFRTAQSRLTTWWSDGTSRREYVLTQSGPLPFGGRRHSALPSLDKWAGGCRTPSA